YVGYSMGGRICLRLALDRPDLVEALVLVGASPGIADADAREARQRSDALLAADLDTGDTGEFLTRWLAQPLFETSTPRPQAPSRGYCPTSPSCWRTWSPITLPPPGSGRATAGRAGGGER